MNMPRLLVLGLAALAAIAAVLLVRGLMGGGTPSASASLPPAVPMAEVLVANQPLQPGQPLLPSQVRWQSWPKANVDSTFITHESTPNLDTALAGTVVRSPIVEGEPISNTKFVHADAAGFMAASLQPGMRAVSIPITTESGAGGFILPNDRVDIMESEQISDSPRRFSTHVIMADIRVLAMDQTFKQDRDQKVVLAKTATLEVTTAQAAALIKAQAGGPLSLALRPLGDNSKTLAPATAANDYDGDHVDGSNVHVIRFGYAPVGANGRKE